MMTHKLQCKAWLVSEAEPDLHRVSANVVGGESEDVVT